MTKISSYTTLRNPTEMDYPFAEAIKSVLAFSDEVVVLDSSDKDDGTTAILEALVAEDSRINVVKHYVDWNAPNHGIQDGITKQVARSHCTGKYLFQFDSDEIVHEKHAPMIHAIVDNHNWEQQKLIVLPVVEYWGSEGKVRVDVNYWKPRLSVNDPDIIHGIPGHLMKYENGNVYACHGTDTCDYISQKTLKPIPCYVVWNKCGEPQQIEILRNAAIHNKEAAQLYQALINDLIREVPGVFHYSWYSIERKIKQYRIFWTNFWKSMYNEDRDERTNPFFPGKLWSEVTDEEIVEYAHRLETETGGHIFHQPWDESQTNHIRVDMDHPSIIKSWIAKHGK